jgi:membrane protein YqaA with SNARE-associated domain
VSASVTPSWLALLKGPDRHSAEDDLNLRRWFAAFLCWLALLAFVGHHSFARAEAGDELALAIWLTATSMFYLSLCCTFLPLPTTWVILLLACNDIGLVESIPWRLVVVATACSAATLAANLNEYHILTFLLRYRSVGSVRNTRLYRRASRWFTVSPFWTVTLFSLIPIPVDVVRMLAVASQYPRLRFGVANFIGRFFRYGIIAGSSAGLDLRPWHIALIQGLLVAAAGVKVVHSHVRRRSERLAVQVHAPEPVAGPADAP